ncbi:MAG: multidrug effflux MFS transporter [Alphaproteobacteria bacterium]|nr:multidrug effflux MFS transporter [Alphaproteobacteria bacterium]
MSASPLLLVSLVILTAIGPLSMQILVPALPAIQAVFGVSQGMAQATITFSMIFVGAMTLVYGPLSDRVGRRPVVLGGAVIYVIGSLACAFAPTINLLIGARAIQAIGAACGMVLSRAIIVDIYGRSRSASVLAYVTVAMAVAPLLSPTIGGLLTDFYGWHAVFIVTTGIGVAVVGLAYIGIPETHRPVDADRVRGSMLIDFWRLLRNPIFSGYAFAAAFSLSVFFAYISAAPYLAVGVLGLTARDYGLWFMITPCGFITGNLLAGRLSARLGMARMTVLGAAVGVGATAVGVGVLVGFGLTPATLFLPTFLGALGSGLLTANALAGAASIDPRIAGTASGLSGFLQNLVAAAVGEIVAVLANGTAWPMIGAMILAASLTLVFALIAHRATARLAPRT